MSSPERREYTLEALIPFGGGAETQEANRAELRRLRAVEAEARAFVAWVADGPGTQSIARGSPHEEMLQRHLLQLWRALDGVS